MTTKKTLILALTLLTAGVLATSCSREDNAIEEEPQNHIPATSEITLTATLAPKGDYGSVTRAITTGKDADKKEILNVTWKKNEQISLYYQTGQTSYAKATATVKSVDEAGMATIEATLTGAINGGTVKFVYPASLANENGDDIDESKILNNQNGLLRTGTTNISKNFDAATGGGTITVSGTTASVDGTISLQSRVCICKMSLGFDGGNAHTSLDPVIGGSKLYIAFGDDKVYTITSNMLADEQPVQGAPVYRPFRSGDVIYVAMLPIENNTLKFSTTYGTNDYSYTVVGTTLTTGKFYRNLSINMVKDGYTNNNGYNQYYPCTVTINDGEALMLDNTLIEVNNGPAIWCAGDATIILKGANSVTASAEGQPAIFIPEGKTLTIQGEGSLTAEATGDSAAGIGGGWQGGYSSVGINCGNIVIESGTITATGRAAGIGGGTGKCGTITINGGTVTATSRYYAAGIGGGIYGTCGTITINGGTVTATGGNEAAGIGSGYRGSCDAITIKGGTVTATGGNEAAGIGSGKHGTCGTVTIKGGTVTAMGDYYAAGVGSGEYGTCGDITIGSGLTSLTATMGCDAEAPIGSGWLGTRGSITIDGSTTWTAGTATEHYTWDDSTVMDYAGCSVTRWTLTKK